MSAEYLHSIDSSYQYERAYKPYQPPPPKKGAKPAAEMNEEEEMAAMDEEEQAMAVGLAGMTGAEVEKDDVPMRPVEKKRLDWRGKTYLAPLTTVGNLVSFSRSRTRRPANARHSRSANFASTTAQISPVAKWSSPNPSLAGAVKNGR